MTGSDVVRGAFLEVLLKVATEKVAGGFGDGNSTFRIFPAVFLTEGYRRYML